MTTTTKKKTVSHAKSLPPPAVIAEVHLIALERIEIEAQVRTEFDEASIIELAADIETHGLLQPVLVNPCGDERYRLICGERRLRAIRHLGHKEIPAVITKIEDKAARLMQLAENIQREDMSLKDTATAIRALFDELGTLEAVAGTVKKSKPWVSKRLSVTCPDFGFRARNLLETGNCEDLELLGTLSQIEQLGHRFGQEADTLIRAGKMNRQQARDYLKKSKEEIAQTNKERIEKEEKRQDQQEKKAKEPPPFNAEYEVNYGIWESVSDSEIHSPSALLARFKPHEQVLIENLLRPAWEEGQQYMDDIVTGLLRFSLKSSKKLPLVAFAQGALGHDMNLLDMVTRLWNADPDNESRWTK